MNRTVLCFGIMCSISLLYFGCKKESQNPSTTYNLNAVNVAGISGTVTFTQTSSTSTTIAIVLNNAPVGSHPAQIRGNSMIEGGPAIITLNPVDSTGKSSTVVTMENNDTLLTYAQLVALDGYLSIEDTNAYAGPVLAQCDIGGNALTNTSQSYSLVSANGTGVTGNILLQERVNNYTLITVNLSNTVAGDTNPVFICSGNDTIGGPIEITLNPVPATTGKSITNVRHFDPGATATYTGLIQYNGYVRVEKSALNYAVISQGNIGINVP